MCPNSVVSESYNVGGLGGNTPDSAHFGHLHNSLFGTAGSREIGWGFLDDSNRVHILDTQNKFSFFDDVF